MSPLKALLIAALAVSGCSKNDHGDHSHDDGEHATTRPTVQAASATEAALAVMAPYDACRVKLAADATDLGECALNMATAARSGKASLAAAGSAADDIASAADALAKTPGDIDKLRIAFGEVSRPVQTLLAAVPEVAAKYRMYECPMAKGYNRWAELSTGEGHEMANPYMGTKMLGCGSEVHDHHKGMEAMTHEPDLIALEMKAFESAKTILEESCGSCHKSANAKSKKAKKALEHLVMDTYPYKGHHQPELGAAIRKVLGVDGEKATMPKDDPGSIKGAELAAVVAWTEAWDKAAAAKVGHHGMGKSHGHDDNKQPAHKH